MAGLKSMNLSPPSARLALSQLAKHRDNDLLNSTSLRTHTLSRRAPLVTIPVYIHIVSTTAASPPSSQHYVTDQVIANQMSLLNTTYAPYSIAFNFISTTRTTNNTWSTNGDNFAMKSALRQGTYRSLNLYFQSNMQEVNGNRPAQILLGVLHAPDPGHTVGEFAVC
jgi:hypothetical protein